MWHSYPHCVGQPELVFFDTTPGSTTPRDPYEPYTATVNGTRFSAYGGRFGAFHVLLFLNRSGQTLVSLNDRYAVRLTHRAFSSGLFNNGGEYLVELLDGGSVAESAVMSSITTPDFFPFVPSLVMVCIGCAFDDDGDCLLYSNVANYGLPFFGANTGSFSGNFCCFGAGTVQLRTACVAADAVSGDSSVQFVNLGFRGQAGSEAGEPFISHASALPGPLHSVADFVPDTVAARLARQGTAVASLQSQSRISFAAGGGSQGATFMDSGGHPEAARPFAFATNATVPRDVAFVRPDVAWRSNVASSHSTNAVLSRLEVQSDAYVAGPPFFNGTVTRDAISAFVVETGLYGNNEYLGSTAAGGPGLVVAAELTLVEVVNDPLQWFNLSPFDSGLPLIQDFMRFRLSFRNQSYIDWAGDLTDTQISALLAGNECLLPYPSGVTAVGGGPAYIRIRGVGP
jgi:hypothetical protein